MPRQALRSATNAFSREGFRTNSLSQNLTVLPAPSGREPLARPQTLHFSRELCRHAKGPILEGAVERSETGGVLLKTKRTSSEEPVRHGRGSKFRTHGTRFWRPLLYQLSYTPMFDAFTSSVWFRYLFGGPCGAGRSSGSARRAARGQIFLTPTAGKIIH